VALSTFLKVDIEPYYPAGAFAELCKMASKASLLFACVDTDAQAYKDFRSKWDAIRSDPSKTPALAVPTRELRDLGAELFNARKLRQMTPCAAAKAIGITSGGRMVQQIEMGLLDVPQVVEKLRQFYAGHAPPTACEDDE
jgi:hypothetical protein